MDTSIYAFEIPILRNHRNTVKLTSILMSGSLGKN